ncbi:ParB N-terminal domain-containing protein [Nocardioides sp. Bht2]|uniref:ParB N-terminal domain-containing protein n=1 Tax=Nocardioides sp. Bht2 TaxID=3392297 RepID=UPI0039B4D37A
MTLAAHPYADAWPMLSKDELAELADDIKANGLRNPIVIYNNTVLDGRNRHAACLLASVEPTFTKFDGDDDAALAFVQSVNNARRHQSKGSLAASWALSMLAAGKRDNGRWEYGAAKSNDRNNLNRKDAAQVGLIADVDGGLLLEVRDDRLALDAAYQRARGLRDAEQELLAEQERIEAEEASALASLPAEYADAIGATYSSARVAFAAWEDTNRAEAARLRKERERAQQAKRDHDEGMKREAQTLSHWTTHYSLAANLRDYPYRDEVLAAMLPRYRAEFLALEAANDWRTA